MHILTDTQKTLVNWLVQNIRAGKLSEEFTILWLYSGGSISPVEARSYEYSEQKLPNIVTPGALDALNANGFLTCQVDKGIKEPTKKAGTQYEKKRRCNLTEKAYKAVDTDFDAPDTTFLKYLTLPPDMSGFDKELEKRCFPTLIADGSGPTLWDSAVRTAGVILEERLRDVGLIVDSNRTGCDLVNELFGKDGKLASKFATSAEREGYRNLYAGMIGTFRNPSAHRLIDPSPEDGGAFIAFVNLLLKKLEALR